MGSFSTAPFASDGLTWKMPPWHATSRLSPGPLAAIAVIRLQPEWQVLLRR